MTTKKQNDTSCRGVGYSDHIAIPCRLASEVLPYVKRIKSTYKDGVSIKTFDTTALGMELYTEEQMTAIAVATKLNGEDK